MQNFEKMGSFYLGQEVSQKDKPELVLYDAKDLTTHAVIIGMTGSGKTGLGVCLIEEALIDQIPVIAVDPKGDLGNLLLEFPDLSPDSFKDWLDPAEAQSKNQTLDELAIEKANLWEKGLLKTHQDKSRIKQLKESTQKVLYTPGSVAGVPVSLLQSLVLPDPVILEEPDLYNAQIESTAAGILALIGVENDPFAKEMILVSQLLKHYWDLQQTVEFSDLIELIQKPPFDKIGVMDLETIYSSKDRLKLAMQLNNLFASPGFSVWTEGEPLSAKKLFYDENNKPKLSVMNIAHLSQESRLFFVTMLLNSVLSWMRTQPGTGSLRAILYIDEVFGYMPPVGNPATKSLLLTLLKQARAYGVGIVLSTQNPVDLDYKGLSNAGTWFIGRLQTAQDREKVMDGLLSASENGFDRDELTEAFNQLGKRKFLLHNVHENSPVIMTTRWALSYLAGPLSRKQIKALTKNKTKLPSKEQLPKITSAVSSQFIVPNEINQYYLPSSHVVTDLSQLTYQSALFTAIEVKYQDKKSMLDTTKSLVLLADFQAGAIAIDWNQSVQKEIVLNQVNTKKPKDSGYFEPSPVAMREELYSDWQKDLKKWLCHERPLVIFEYKPLKLYSKVGESKDDFVQRISIQIREARDQEVQDLRKSVGKKLDQLQKKLNVAERRVQKESDQASSKTLSAILSGASTLFSAFMGRKTVSATNIRKLSTAINKAKGAFDEKDDIVLAESNKALVEKQMGELEMSFNEQSRQLIEKYNIETIEVTHKSIYPKSTAIRIQLFGLGWRPGIINDQGEWQEI